MKIFLDDSRDAPSGWVRCRWPDEVIELLRNEQVEVISLDHDLGDDERGTGYDVLLWLECRVVFEGFQPPELLLHTSNPVARDRMRAAIASIKRLSARR